MVVCVAGASKDHPAGRLVTRGISELSEGRVTTALATTCDQFNGIIVPHPIDQQVISLRHQVARLIGRIAIFAHSQACLPVAAMLSEQPDLIDPADVIFAGTPLEDNKWLEGIIERARPADPVAALREVSANVSPGTEPIESVLQFSSRQIALTRACLQSYPDPGVHLHNLQQVPESTILVSGDEKVTDCTPEKVVQLLPHVRLTTATHPEAGNVVILPDAEHNLRGFCEKEIPKVITRKISGIV